ncbi:hypothetical protein JOC86_001828 [Bacillus pakistanensis]|uniref:DNA-directed RNA polymerase subunit beta n=1 Tax=Rossellomorea pakistanensis TaxID=992288 RepID=A0ABS2NBQ2_9BACI|nr:DNA-directed RNA polymerase subunit beta [Bacillus pakistanensis]MBM7585286.1 hypothetical protein [Bacillus pakistanensis]
MAEKELLQEGKTREEIKSEKKLENESQDKKWIRVRLLPIWLRVILFVLFFAVSLVLGAIVGYSVIGDGKASDAFKKSTWEHIIQIVTKEK